MRQNRICLNAVNPKIPDSFSEDRLMFSSVGAQPISLKSFRGLGHFPNKIARVYKHEHCLLSAFRSWQVMRSGYRRALLANDYITKPFGTEELLARIRAVLRSHRHSEENESTPGGKFRLQDLLIDYDTRQVFVGKEETDLTQTEYNIINELGVGYRMLAEDE